MLLFHIERKAPTLTTPEVTPGERIVLRISGQPEEPSLLNERQAKVLPICSSMKKVLRSPNKSTMFNNLIKNYSQRQEVLKVEDRVRCQPCFKYQRQSETLCTCGSSRQGITEEVKKQTDQRINGRFIMYVPSVHNLA